MSESTTPASAARHGRFKLSIVALGMYGAALAAVIWVGLWLEHDDTRLLGRVVIRFVMWFPLLYGVGWMVYRIARRSSRAGSIAFACAVAAVGGLNIAILIERSNRARNEAKIDEVNRLAAELRAEEAAALTRGETPDPNSAMRIEARRRLGELSRLPGDEGAVGRASAAALQESERLTRIYNELVAAMEPAGAIDDVVFVDGEARKRRIEHVRKTAHACAELERFFTAYPEFVGQRAREEGASDETRSKLRDALKSHPRINSHREFYACARESYETVARMLDLLDDPDRRWVIDPESGVLFEDSDDLAEWHAAVERLEMLETEQQRIQQRLLKD